MANHNIYGVNETFTLAASGEETLSLDLSTVHDNLNIFFTVSGSSDIDLNVASGTGDPDRTLTIRGGLYSKLSTPPDNWFFDSDGTDYTLSANETTELLLVITEIGSKVKFVLTNNGSTTDTIAIRGDY